MRLKLAILTLLLFPCPTAFSAQLDLPRDSNGWTTFSPSVDTDVVYVDSVTGNDTSCRSYRTTDAEMGTDPFNPVGAVIPCLTVATAGAKTSANSPDWILIKRGSVFTTGIAVPRSGRSSTEPFVIASYGSTGDLPLFKISADYGLDISGYAETARWMAVSGLDFYASVRDPASPDYVGEPANFSGMFIYKNPAGYYIEGVLVEGCKFRFFSNGVIIGSEVANQVSSIMLRRNIIENSYSTSTAASQGISASYFDEFLLEENVFYHNGWLVQNDGDETTETGEATMFNHHFYLTNITNADIKENVFIKPSSTQSKIKNTNTGVGENLLIDNNLYIGGEVVISIGAPDQPADYSTVNPTVINNVALHTGYENATNREIAWFFYNFNLDGGLVRNNIMAHQEDPSLLGHFWHIQMTGRNTIFSNNIQWNTENIASIDINEKDVGDPDRTGNVFSGNIFDTKSQYIVSALFQTLAGYSFSGNEYYSTKTVDTWFYFDSTAKTNAQWAAATGDDSTYTQHTTFPDPDRDIDTYMTSIGETATIDAFIVKCRAQDRYNWDTECSADVVNDYIRAGFGVSEYQYGGNASINGTGQIPLSGSGTMTLQ